jgi:hypothetical protein
MNPSPQQLAIKNIIDRSLKSGWPTESIKVHNGLVVIDKEDLPVYEKYYWRFVNSNKHKHLARYEFSYGTNETIFFHQEVLGLRWGGYKVRFLNDDRLDIRKSNLFVPGIIYPALVRQTYSF